jgi:two-component system phosphate regulon response regulator PhoB
MCSPDYEFYLLLAHILNTEGFDASLAEGAAEALASMTSNAGVALIVDCQTDAFRISDWVREIRATSAGEVLPIAVFVGAGNQQLYLEALKAGVDEIFVRPFNPDRLLSYLGGLLPQDSSRPGTEDTSKNALAYAEITMLLDSRRVEFNDTEVRLSPIEFRLLQHFLRRPGYVFSRDDLIQGAWPHGLFRRCPRRAPSTGVKECHGTRHYQNGTRCRLRGGRPSENRLNVARSLAGEIRRNGNMTLRQQVVQIVQYRYL